MSTKTVIAGIDKVVDNFSKNNRMLNELMTRSIHLCDAAPVEHAAAQPVLKLRVATNTPDWMKRIPEACHEELISDAEHGRPH